MNIFRLEGPVSFSRNHQVTLGFVEPPHHGVTVPLTALLFDQTRSRLGDLTSRISECIVVDYYHFVDHAGIEKSIDDGANTALLVIGRNNNTHSFAFVHDS